MQPQRLSDVKNKFSFILHIYIRGLLITYSLLTSDPHPRIGKGSERSEHSLNANCFTKLRLSKMGKYICRNGFLKCLQLRLHTHRPHCSRQQRVGFRTLPNCRESDSVLYPTVESRILFFTRLQRVGFCTLPNCRESDSVLYPTAESRILYFTQLQRVGCHAKPDSNE